MLSYQHAYHAGNAADVHKHMVLAGLLELLTKKPRPISYLETHAGRGLYDLRSPEARKTAEADQGIRALPLPDCAYARVLAAFRGNHGEDAYPGSPLIARAMLRPGDTMHLMELHPAEHAALKRAMAGSGAHVHRRDGFEGVLALSPPTPRRGLVLVDPSYEIKTDYETTAAFARRLMAKWPQAVLMIWYPVLPAARHEALISALHLPHLRHEVRLAPPGGRGMTGSGLAIIGAPHGIAPLLAATKAVFAAIPPP